MGILGRRRRIHPMSVAGQVGYHETNISKSGKV